MTKKLALLAIMACAVAGPVQAQSLDIDRSPSGRTGRLRRHLCRHPRHVATARATSKTLENPGEVWRAGSRCSRRCSRRAASRAAAPGAAGDLVDMAFEDRQQIGGCGAQAEFAKAGDADSVNNQIKILGDTCGACHRAYRAR